MIMKKRLILILNGKGGVGKSFFAVNFIQYLKDHGISHAAFDSDDENSTLKRFHSEVGFIDPGRAPDIDLMVEALVDKDVVVVDCRRRPRASFSATSRRRNCQPFSKA